MVEEANPHTDIQDEVLIGVLLPELRFEGQ